MCPDNISPSDDLKKEILKGRIWPAINSCVGNRYKIVVSLFAFYSFIMTSTINSIRTRFSTIQLYISVMISLFTIFNSINYILNSGEQWRIENPDKSDNFWEKIKRNNIEIFFLIIMMGLIWGSFWLIKD
jgi:hypothetical protein